jgi:hypothetical protein
MGDTLVLIDSHLLEILEQNEPCRCDWSSAGSKVANRNEREESHEKRKKKSSHQDLTFFSALASLLCQTAALQIGVAEPPPHWGAPG